MDRGGVVGGDKPRAPYHQGSTRKFATSYEQVYLRLHLEFHSMFIPGFKGSPAAPMRIFF